MDPVAQQSDSDEAEQDQFVALREELSQMPFEELENLKQKIGLKMFNQVMRRDSAPAPAHVGKKRFKRENKNRPMEMSSKRKAPKLRHIIPVKKNLKRDPRFDDLSGEFDETKFNKSYKFIEDIKEREKAVLQKKLKKENDEKKKEQMKQLLQRMKYKAAQEKQREENKERQRAIRRRERELVQHGKKAFHLKQVDKKKLALAEKFKELKKSGKIEKYMQRKRKKNASKEKRKLPRK